MKKNDEILKKFQFDLELGVFKLYDSSRPNSVLFSLNSEDRRYFTDYLIFTNVLDKLGYRRLKISTGSITNYTINGIYVNHTLKTFYTTSDELFFMMDVVNEIPKYLLDEYSIVREKGKDVLNYEYE